jgi:octaprenyl-diphosphate synthase
MESEYTKRLKKIEAAISGALPKYPDKPWLEAEFGPFRIPPEDPAFSELNLPAFDLISRGGKRWRPLLLLLACELGGGGDSALPLAPLVEFAHNGSLILDDIEDGSDTRRGMPAVHILHGEDVAINSGCLLYFLGLSSIGALQIHDENKSFLHQRYAWHMKRLHLGQSLDISWHRDSAHIPSRSQYFLMCGMKTGCLARMAAEFGYFVAKQNAIQADRFGEIFEDTGIAFQILDDVKNLRKGNPGKKRGDDVVEGKKSLPLILLLERRPDFKGEAADCVRIAAAEGPESAAVDRFIALAEEAGALDAAEAIADGMLKDSMSRIEREYFPSDERERLLGFFSFLA